MEHLWKAWNEKETVGPIPAASTPHGEEGTLICLGLCHSSQAVGQASAPSTKPAIPEQWFSNCALTAWPHPRPVAPESQGTLPRCFQSSLSDSRMHASLEMAVLDCPARGTSPPPPRALGGQGCQQLAQSRVSSAR